MAMATIRMRPQAWILNMSTNHQYWMISQSSHKQMSLIASYLVQSDLVQRDGHGSDSKENELELDDKPGKT
jgi:hypothetical protein